MNHCPLSFSTLEIKEEEIDGNKVRSEDLVCQTEDHLLTFPRTYRTLLEIGYQWYQVNCQKEPLSHAVNPNPFFKKKQRKNGLRSLFQKLM